MEKGINKIVILVVVCFLTVICISLTEYYSGNKNRDNKNESICKIEDCNNFSERIIPGVYEDYCYLHICEECGSEKNEEDKYCSFHLEQQIKLSDSQINEINKVVEDYCEMLKSQNSNILEINLFTKEPQTTIHNIFFHCNVIREDSNINYAMIYIIPNEKGFEVLKLEYDEN